MLRLALIFCALATALFTRMTYAELVISDASIRLLPPSLPNTSAYFTLNNTGQQDVLLVGASSEIGQRTELHGHVLKGEMMHMEHQDAVIIPAHGTVRFAPGGLHLMIFGLKAPLKKAQSVKLELITQDGDTFSFDAVVTDPNQHAHHH